MTGNALHTIVVPVRGDGKGDNVLAHAAALARRHAAQVKVVHCHPKPDDLMPYGVVIPQVLRSQIEEVAQRNVDVTRDQLDDEFRTLATDFGLLIQDPVAGRATAEFHSYEGKQVDAVRHFGRLADLLCVSQPDPKLNLGNNTLKAALFASGRPVMMCPPKQTVSDSFADHVTLGWNGSIEASRALAMAMPLISAANTVTILSSGSTGHDASPEQVVRYLELKSVSASIRSFDADAGKVGELLLAETEDVGAGLLIMGAYHESFERESIFGGVSQHVVQNAKFPILMVH